MFKKRVLQSGLYRYKLGNMSKRSEALVEARTSAHNLYKASLDGVFTPLGFTPVTRAEIDSQGCYPALNMEAADPLNSIKLPKGWQRLVRGIYPAAPLFVNRLQLTDDSVFMSLQLQNHLPGDPKFEIKYPERDGVRERLDPWVIIDWSKGDASYFKYIIGSGGHQRTNQVLTATQLRGLTELPDLVAKAPVVYPSSHKLFVADMNMD